MFGAGAQGIQACDFIGYARVLCFADTYRFHREWCGKMTISFEEMVSCCQSRHDVAVVIANEKHSAEMAKQLTSARIEKYCIYPAAGLWERIPSYYLYRKAIHLSLAQIISKRNLSAYHCFCVYGDNVLAPFVVMELWEQCPNAEVRFISEGNVKGVLGVPIVGFDEAVQSADCFVLNVRRNEDDIRERLNDAGIGQDNILDIYDVDRFESAFHHSELIKYKNLHKGKRCFLIGTGPSLTVDDLNTLHVHKEICISCNKIYRVYDKTPWRADYIGLSDTRIISDCKNELLNIPGQIFIADPFHSGANTKIDTAMYYHAMFEEYYPNLPDFSSDFISGFFNGRTVIYDFGLQFAAYCGFDEIYLLGCDCSTIGNVADVQNHFIKDYFYENEKGAFKEEQSCWDMVFKAYEAAEQYSRKHGFRIFNATRGGNLEVFERVDFDHLLA